MKIYEPKGKAYEYSPLALNYFKGCDHNCKYCYVPNIIGRWNSSYDHSTVINPTDFNELESSAKKMQGCDKQILLSFTGDPYCNAENGETRTVLEILNQYNHKVSILTKNPQKALKDLSIIKEYGNRIKVGTSLTFDNLKDSLEWESGASAPESRINGLKQFAMEGIRTWASFEPVFVPEQSLNLLKQIIPFIDAVKIGKLNHNKKIEAEINWSVFLVDAVKILRDNNMNDRFYIKKNLQAFNNGIYLSENEMNEKYQHL